MTFIHQCHALLVYIITLIFQTHHLKKENKQILLQTSHMLPSIDINRDKFMEGVFEDHPC